MGRAKAALPWGGQTFASSQLRALGSAGFDPLLIVCGVHAAETRAALPEDVDVRVLENPAPERGQLSSLKIALHDLGAPSTVTATLVALVDHPAVRAETLAQLRAAAGPSRIVVPTYDDRRGHPVVFGRDLFEELLRTPDTAGARQVVRRDASRVSEVAVPDPGIHVDIDTPEEFERASRER